MTAAPKPVARNASDARSLEGVLHGLANMQLGGTGGERQVIGERHNLVNRDSPSPPKDEGKGKGKPPTKAAHNPPPEVIEISSDEDENAHARTQAQAQTAQWSLR